MTVCWKEIRFTVTDHLAESLSEVALDCGALSASIEDADVGTALERPIYGEPNMATPGVWPHSQLCLLVDAATDILDFLQRLTAGLGLSDMPVWTETSVSEQDWVRATQAQFNPIVISNRLCIRPSWCVDDIPTASPEQIQIILDPGLAFGTGSHPTTALCLRWLDQHLSQQPTQSLSILDYGCGSGILAIAARKLGAPTCHGVDIDPQAIEAARRNAQQNHVEDILFSDATSPLLTQFDIVVANILTNPLIAMAPLLSKLIAPQGWLVLSGILSEQSQEVINAYQPWIALNVDTAEDGWVRLSGQQCISGNTECRRS